MRRRERGSYPLLEANFMPVMCNHCDEAPCMEAAHDGAVRKRSDGIVLIDPDLHKIFPDSEAVNRALREYVSSKQFER